MELNSYAYILFVIFNVFNFPISGEIRQVTQLSASIIDLKNRYPKYFDYQFPTDLLHIS